MRDDHGVPPPLARIYETVLYADDLPAAVGFYRDVLGLHPADELDDLGAAFRLPEGAVLLIFEPSLSSRPGRPVPSHGAVGAGHVAFQVDAPALDLWREHLTGLGIAIELEQPIGVGGRQLYFRDPAGNSVELVEGEAWPGYASL